MERTSSAPLAHVLLGLLPITNTSLPPLIRSSWLNHDLFHSLPFSVADWMYLLSSEAFLSFDFEDSSVAECNLGICEKRASDSVGRQSRSDRVEAQGGEDHK